MKRWHHNLQGVKVAVRGVVTLVILGLIALGTSLYLSYVTQD